MIFYKAERSRTLSYHKRGFAKKRVNIAVLAGFILFLVGTLLNQNVLAGFKRVTNVVNGNGALAFGFNDKAGYFTLF